MKAVKKQKIVSIKPFGIRKTIDLGVDHPNHNFYAEGVVVSNSHSISYASIAAATTYLKFNHPKEFFLSLLKMTKHEPDPIEEISKINRELNDFGIKLLRPDLVCSDLDFKIEGGNIRFGLLSIKGISDSSIEKLIKFRSSKSTKFEIFKGAKEAKLSVSILSALIQAGTLNCGENSRARVVFEAQLWGKMTENERKKAIILGPEYKENLPEIIKAMTSKKDEKGALMMKPSRLETLRRDTDGYRKIYIQNKFNQDFTNWYYERKLLGYSPDILLKNIFVDRNRDLMSIREILDGDEDDRVCLVGFVKEASHGTSRKKTKYYKIIVGDESGEITVLLFDSEKRKRIEQCKKENNDKLPKEDNIIVVRGVRKGDAIFGDQIAIECQKIYTRLGDVKEKKDDDVLEKS